MRNPGATVNFLGFVNGGAANLDSGANRITFLNALSNNPAAFGLVGNNGGILPFAMANSGPTIGGDFASYDFVNNSITYFTGYVTSIAAASSGDIVKEAATEILTGNKTITGLLLTGGATVAEDGFTLTLGGGISGELGAILSTNGANTIVGGTLNVGSGEGVAMTSGTGSVTSTNINSTVTGGSSSGGLTVSSAGTAAFAATVYLPNANTFTGNAYLDGFANLTLSIGSNTSLARGPVPQTGHPPGQRRRHAGQLFIHLRYQQRHDRRPERHHLRQQRRAQQQRLAEQYLLHHTHHQQRRPDALRRHHRRAGRPAVGWLQRGRHNGRGVLRREHLQRRHLRDCQHRRQHSGCHCRQRHGPRQRHGGPHASRREFGRRSAVGFSGTHFVQCPGDQPGRGRHCRNPEYPFGASSYNSTNTGSTANSSLSFSNTVTIATANTVGVATPVTFNGNLGGPATLTMVGLNATTGPGSLTLNGNDSAYTAGITLNAGSLGALGQLIVGSSNPNPNLALGTGVLTLTNGQLINNYTSAIVLANPVALNTAAAPGTYVKFGGGSGNNNAITFRNALPTANILLNTASQTINLIVSTPTTFDDAITSGLASVTVNMISDGTGSGTSTLTLSQANTFLAGNINIAAGTLDLTGLGTLATGTTAFAIDVGGTLLLDNSGNQAAFNPTRIPNAVTTIINFNGGTLQVNGTTTAGATSTVSLNTAVENFVSGYSTVINNNGNVAGGATSVLALNTFSLTATPGATVNFQGGTSGNQTLGGTGTQTQISFAAGLPTGTAISGITVTDSSQITVATLNSGNPFAQTVKMGVSSTAAAAGNVIAQLNYVTPANATTTSNVYANTSSGNTLANVASVSSILIGADNTTVAPFAAGQAYTVTSGNIVMTRNGGSGTSGSTITAPIAFGGNPGYLITNDGVLTLNGLITSTAGGLVIAGGGTLSLPNANVTTAGAASYLGGTWINGGRAANSGTVLMGTNNAISSSGTLTLINGTIAAATYTSGAVTDSAGPVTLTNPITLGASATRQ